MVLVVSVTTKLLTAFLAPLPAALLDQSAKPDALAGLPRPFRLISLGV
jgi:hypothetical protein